MGRSRRGRPQAGPSRLRPRPRLRLRPRPRVLLLLLGPPVLTAVLLYLPVPGLESLRTDPAGTVITDRHGETLACLAGPEGEFLWKLSWEEIPPEARRIFLRVEDRRFYAHRGVDPAAALRAAALNLAGRRAVSGASTISMQLARLVRPHGGGLRGKLEEAVTALRLEAQLGKREILRLYLNHLPFGYNTRGLGAAAVRYFDRPAAELTPAQLLVLATIPRAPARYDPFTAPGAVLERAAALAPGLGVSRAELTLALASCRRGEPPRTAPHFVRQVAKGLAHGRGETVRVITSLDAGLYREVRQVLREELARAGGAAAGGAGPGSAAWSSAGAGRRQEPRGAPADAGVLVLANDGEVLAWVGSPEDGVFVDAVTVRSSTGSTLKPFLYALALEKGYTAASLLPDLPLSFGVTESYRPANFDRKSRAAVRLRTALASSLNAPAVHLLSELGLDEFLALCRRLGLGFPPAAGARYGLGAAIGNADASLVELTRAFSVFPNRGELQPLRLELARLGPDGTVRRRTPAGSPERVFPEETAWLIGDILSDPAARTPGFGASSRFNALPEAMFKSGTSSEYESLWCLGATGAHTVGVWAGNLDGRPCFGTTGSSLPAAIVLAALEVLERDRGVSAREAAPLPRPASLREVLICTASGRPASAACPATRIEYLPAVSPAGAPEGRQAGQAGQAFGSAAESGCSVHGSRAGGAGEPEERVQAGLLAGRDGAPRILFPLPEQLFFRDRGVAPQGQRLEAWIAASPEGPLAVRITGSAAAAHSGELTLAYPFRVALPLEPGSYRLEVTSPAGSDSVRYHVR